MNSSAGPLFNEASKEGREQMLSSLLAFVDVGGTPSNIHVGLAALGSAIAVGLIGMAASTAVGRNPGGATKVLVQSILAIAFAEAIMFYTLFLVK